MADTGSLYDAGQSAPAKPFLSRLIGVFIEPGETFDDIARKPDFIAPLILLILVALAVVATMLAKIGMSRIIMQALTQSGRTANMDPAQLNQIVQKSAAIYRIVMPVSAVLVTAVLLLVVAGLGLLFLNGFFGQRVTFKEVFSVTCYSYLPSILGAVMAVAVVFFGDPDAFNPRSPAPTNPGYFMNPLTSSHAVFALMSSLDVLTFWFLILLAIGLSRVSRNKVKAGSIFMTYLGAWVLLVIAKVGFALLTTAG
jgi:Yip1 domain